MIAPVLVLLVACDINPHHPLKALWQREIQQDTIVMWNQRHLLRPSTSIALLSAEESSSDDPPCLVVFPAPLVVDPSLLVQAE